MRFVPALVVLILASAVPAADAPPRLAITGGKVHTVTGEIIDGGVVLVSNGKIAHVGDASTKVPDGHEVIDASGRWVLPGFIDLHSHIGGTDINDMVYPVNPGFRVLDNIQPNNTMLKRAVAGGVTTILFIPGSGTNMSGFGALMKTAGDTVEDCLIRFPGALKIAQGGNPERRGGDLGRGRMGMNWIIRSALEEGKAYTEAWDAYLAGKRETAPEKNPRLEYFRGLFHREYPVVVHTQGVQLIQATLRILHDELGLWVVIDHGTFDGYKMAAEVAKRGVMVMNGPRQFRYDYSSATVVGLAAGWFDGGVEDVGINTDSPVVPQEELFFQASMAIRLGLDPAVALRGITINGAKAVGIDKRVGSIEKGKDADIVIFTGDPFDIRSFVEKTIVDGRVVYDTSREPRRF